jgi:hypothetical protein
MVAPGESARSRKIAAVRAVARWGTRRFATAPLRVPQRQLPSQGTATQLLPLRRVTGADPHKARNA